VPRGEMRPADRRARARPTPRDLKQRVLEEELAKEMAAPLEAFVAALDIETEPVRVAALPRGPDAL